MHWVSLSSPHVAFMLIVPLTVMLAIGFVTSTAVVFVTFMVSVSFVVSLLLDVVSDEQFHF